MDRKVMDLIDVEVAKLPIPKSRQGDFQLYEEHKKRICGQFPLCTEHEYICKKIARRCGI